ncbi:hypothetical protein PCANC_02619 [Puccinia coronata f. sp. avenae]|uniref:Uncharacterized protein n=1 Tax=Puccinia coronata f. sp. avenae TaxID=200324 RepID=A0A2N5W5H0_9BASI|nr:hypothetical protein PCANC_02619 [Puccinia coronata f. sp. avenae]
MLYGIPPDQTKTPTTEAMQAACVEQLLADVARMEESMRKMMSFLQNSPILNPPFSSQANQSQGNVNADQFNQSCSRNHAQHTVPNPTFHGPMGPKFSHIAQLEPLKIQELWFAGDLAQLGSFLRSVRDF